MVEVSDVVEVVVERVRMMAREVLGSQKSLIHSPWMKMMRMLMLVEGVVRERVSEQEPGSVREPVRELVLGQVQELAQNK